LGDATRLLILTRFKVEEPTGPSSESSSATGGLSALDVALAFGGVGPLSEVLLLGLVLTDDSPETLPAIYFLSLLSRAFLRAETLFGAMAGLTDSRTSGEEPDSEGVGEYTTSRESLPLDVLD
jgi:hypothetical protein